MSLVEQMGFTCPTSEPPLQRRGHFEIVRRRDTYPQCCHRGVTHSATSAPQSARFNAIVVAIKVAVIVLFICFGIWVVDGANWTPFIPENQGEYGQFGWSGVLQAAGIIFFAYIGFDAVSTAAQEAKNPQKDMPIGIWRASRHCARLVSAVLTGGAVSALNGGAGARSTAIPLWLSGGSSSAPSRA
jgi:amino acid transporter